MRIHSLVCATAICSDFIVLETILIIFVFDRFYLTFRVFWPSVGNPYWGLCGNLCHFSASKRLIIILKCFSVLQGCCGSRDGSHSDDASVPRAPGPHICVSGWGECFKYAFLSNVLDKSHDLHAVIIRGWV